MAKKTKLQVWTGNAFENLFPETHISLINMDGGDNLLHKLNTIEAVAKGAQQSVVYNDYEEAIEIINNLPEGALNFGQNIYIIDVDIPDLWVSGTQDTKNKYNYVSNEELINALNTEGAIWVGHYILSQLEGGSKAVVSGLYSQVTINGVHQPTWDADTKLDKSTKVTGYPQTYVKAGDGTQTMYNVSTDIVNGAIPRRTTNGDVLVNDMPVSPYGAVNKNYVVRNTIQNLKDGESANNVYQTFESTNFQVLNPHVQYVGLTVPNGFKLQLPDYPEFNGVDSVILNGSGIVAGDHCFVAGGHNAALGQYNAVFGHDNITQGGSATAFGIMNYVDGDFAIAFGDQNRVEANRGFAAGYQNSIDSASIGGTVFGSNNLLMGWGSDSFVSGHYNISKYPYQAIFGQYNDNKADTLFEVGRGSAGMRSNAFEVYKSGIAKIYGRPTAYEDVVNKGFVEDNFLTKKTGITQLNQAYVKTTAGNNEMFGIDTNVSANTLVRRNNNGDIIVGSNPASTNVAVNANYVSNNFIAKPSAPVNSIITYVNGTGAGTKPYTNKVPYENQFCSCAGPDDGIDEPVGTGYYISKSPINPYHLSTKKYVDDNLGLVEGSIILGGVDSFVKRIPAYLKNEPESYVGACCVIHDERHVIIGFDQDNAVFLVYNTADGTTTEYDDYTIE